MKKLNYPVTVEFLIEQCTENTGEAPDEAIKNFFVPLTSLLNDMYNDGYKAGLKQQSITAKN